MSVVKKSKRKRQQIPPAKKPRPKKNRTDLSKVKLTRGWR